MSNKNIKHVYLIDAIVLAKFGKVKLHRIRKLKV